MLLRRRRKGYRKRDRQGKVQHRPPRISESAKRRNWARTGFVPTAGWLHLTDYGYVDYDLWEHIDSPPKGDAHGFRTHKVIHIN